MHYLTHKTLVPDRVVWAQIWPKVDKELSSGFHNALAPLGQAQCNIQLKNFWKLNIFVFHFKNNFIFLLILNLFSS